MCCVCVCVAVRGAWCDGGAPPADAKTAAVAVEAVEAALLYNCWCEEEEASVHAVAVFKLVVECDSFWSGGDRDEYMACGVVAMLLMGEVAMTAAAARLRLAQLAAFADMHMAFRLMFLSFSLMLRWKICANLGSLCLDDGCGGCAELGETWFELLGACGCSCGVWGRANRKFLGLV